MENGLENNFNLREAIIKVIAFFDLFDYVLTDFEIWRMLSIKCQLIEVVEALASLADKSPQTLPYHQPDIGLAGLLSQERELVESKNGFYFLAGQEKNIRVRLSRYNFTDRKFKRALLVSKIFKFIPWIKMIAVGNLLGAHNLKDDSDLDFFIAAEDKRIWLTRFFCAGVAKLLGLRPRANNSRDKICLSFYASEKAMDLSGLKLKISPTLLPARTTASQTRSFWRGVVQSGGCERGEAENLPYPPSRPNDCQSDKVILAGCRPVGRVLKGADNVEDIYFIYWLVGLMPFYDVGGVYKKFMAANYWLKNYLPNWQSIDQVKRRRVKPFLSEFYHDLIDLFVGGLEPQFKALQLRLLPPQLKNLMNQDSRVVVNDQIIKLHANDRREEYREKYYRKIYEIFK